MKRVLICAALASMVAGFAADDSDVVLKAMRDEMARAKTLKLPNLDPPYLIQYSIEDADMLTVSATLGALLNSTHSPVRIQDVRVRVGDYNFDNTNYIYSDFFGGAHYDSSEMPIEPNYDGLRHLLWLASDHSFKGAEEAIARKRSALKNVNLPDPLPDYTKAEPVQAVEPVHITKVDEGAWKKRIVQLSGLFSSYPEVQASNVEFQSVQSTDYTVTSEGSVIRQPDNIAFIRMRAYGQASDGAALHDADVVQAWDVAGLPPEAELRRRGAQLAAELVALSKAPEGFNYDGPVLFEAQAAAQSFGQLLGDNLKIARKPISEPGRAAPFLPSELESRAGARILPDFMDVVDDPTQTEFAGRKLLGHYDYDIEAVPAKPLTLVEKGVLKDFLRTRTPALKGFEGSNGRARMPGNFGARAAGFGNLFVRANEHVTDAELRAKLMALCKQRNKPYGLIVRKLDWPSSASYQELQREMSAMMMSGGGTRPVSLPLVVYQVYPDGREQLVRGLRFRGLSTRSLRDIAAASDAPFVYNFMDAPVPFALMGAGNFESSSTVIAPAVLFDELELERIVEEMPNPPIVPPPTTN